MGCWSSKFKELCRGSFADKNVRKYKRKHFLKGMAAFRIFPQSGISLKVFQLEKEENHGCSPGQQSQEGLSALPANAATSINSSCPNCCVIRKMREE